MGKVRVRGWDKLEFGTADFSCVRIFYGSVWFVRAIGFAYFLWHAQTIRFHEIFERNLNSLYEHQSSHALHSSRDNGTKEFECELGWGEEGEGDTHPNFFFKS